MSEFPYHHDLDEYEEDERSGIGPEGVRMLFDPTYKFTMTPWPVVEMLRRHVLDSLTTPSIYRTLTTVERDE